MRRRLRLWWIRRSKEVSIETLPLQRGFRVGEYVEIYRPGRRELGVVTKVDSAGRIWGWRRV